MGGLDDLLDGVHLVRGSHGHGTVNGDALMVKAGGKVRKLHLASIRPPRPEDTESSAKRGPDFRPLYDVPFMFEAREFLRKKLIGHQVQVTVDYVQAARTEPGQ